MYINTSNDVKLWLQQKRLQESLQQKTDLEAKIADLEAKLNKLAKIAEQENAKPAETAPKPKPAETATGTKTSRNCNQNQQKLQKPKPEQSTCTDEKPKAEALHQSQQRKHHQHQDYFTKDSVKYQLEIGMHKNHQSLVLLHQVTDTLEAEH